MSKIGVIRVRGGVNADGEVKRTLTQLNLHRVNYCTVLDDTPTTKGMITKVKDYVTWGELSEEIVKALQARAGEGKRFARLHPPIGGYERKGIKQSFTAGGALGYRKEKMDELVRKMLK